jgi:hypothetical protein
MMIKSTPASSSHLAEIPVPAPPPTMGRPSDTLARKRFKIPSRLLSHFMIGSVLSKGGALPTSMRYTKDNGNVHAIFSTCESFI